MGRLQKCCCCATLQTGAVIIGWLGLGASMVNIGFGSMYIADPSLMNLQKELPPVWKTLIMQLLVLQVVGGVAGAISNLLLLWGATTKRRMLLLPGLILNMERVIMTVVVVMVIGIVYAQQLPTLSVIVFVAGFPLAALDFYLWFCLLHYFRELREREREAAGIPVENGLKEPITMHEIMSDSLPYKKM